jgi:hypothetical protein
MTSNTLFKTLVDDIAFDKFKYLLFYLVIIYAAYSVSVFLTNVATKESVDNKKIFNNIIMLFLSFSLLYFVSDAENLFRRGGWMILAFTIIAMIMHPFLSNEFNGGGYQFIDIKDFFFRKPISFVYIPLFTLMVVYSYLLSGFSIKYLALPGAILLYLLSGLIINQKVALWFLSLLPLMTISLEVRKSILLLFLYPVIMSYIIHSGFLVDFELYKE